MVISSTTKRIYFSVDGACVAVDGGNPFVNAVKLPEAAADTLVQIKPKPKLLYTHSSSKSYRNCNYQYFVQYVQGYRPVKDAKALVFGTLVHLCLEAYWKARQRGDGKPLDAALAMLKEAPTILKSAFVLDIFDYVRAKVSLAAYALVWGVVRCRVLAVEAQFRHPLLNPDGMKPSETFERSGKIDLIIELLDEGNRIAVVEHKTSAADIGSGSDYRTRLTLDEQVSFYYAGAKSLGFNPDVVIYDVLRKFREKPYEATPPDKINWVTDRKTKEVRLESGQRLKDETPDEYGQRLVEIVKEDYEQYIVRIRIHRLMRERIRFAKEVWNQARVMEFALDNNFFPQNSDACFKGQSRCSFISHCYYGGRLDDINQFKKSDTLHPELEQEQDEQEPAT